MLTFVMKPLFTRHLERIAFDQMNLIKGDTLLAT